MAYTHYRCDVCSSEILADGPTAAPRVCLLCRLSAEEAVSMVVADETAAGPQVDHLIVNGNSAEHVSPLP